jgi:hypothetical protein
MLMPVSEMDSSGSAASLQQKKSNKISEQENPSSLGKAETNDSAIEDTVKISQKSRDITKEFERTEDGKASELKEQERQSRDNEKNLRTYKENS